MEIDPSAHLAATSVTDTPQGQLPPHEGIANGNEAAIQADSIKFLNAAQQNNEAGQEAALKGMLLHALDEFNPKGQLIVINQIAHPRPLSDRDVQAMTVAAAKNPKAQGSVGPAGIMVVKTLLKATAQAASAPQRPVSAAGASAAPAITAAA